MGGWDLLRSKDFEHHQPRLYAWNAMLDPPGRTILCQEDLSVTLLRVGIALVALGGFLLVGALMSLLFARRQWKALCGHGTSDQQGKGTGIGGAASRDRNTPSTIRGSVASGLLPLIRRSSGALALDTSTLSLPDHVSHMVALQGRIIHDSALTISEKIGSGQFGEVYAGVWKGLPVAVKQLVLGDQDQGMRQQVVQEVAVLLNISHANIVATYTYDVQNVGESCDQVVCGEVAALADRLLNDGQKGDGVWCVRIIQERCTGGCLRRSQDDGRFKNAVRGGTVEYDRVLQVAVDIVQGLAHIHSLGIIHGDLHPGNVLLQGDGRDGVVAKLADFGLSVTMSGNQQAAQGMKRGTPFYAAPETATDGELTPASDVYALGVILWELYHGSPPWRLQRTRQRFNTATLLKFDPDCPAPYRLLSQRCMDIEMSQRPSIQDCLTELVDMQMQGLLSLLTHQQRSVSNSGSSRRLATMAHTLGALAHLVSPHPSCSAELGPNTHHVSQSMEVFNEIAALYDSGHRMQRPAAAASLAADLCASMEGVQGAGPAAAPREVGSRDVRGGSPTPATLTDEGPSNV